MRKTRLDELMVQRGLLPTAEEAAPRVYAREVKVDGAFATSPAILVSPETFRSLGQGIIDFFNIELDFDFWRMR